LPSAASLSASAPGAGDATGESPVFTLFGSARTYRQRRNRRIAGLVILALATLGIVAPVAVDQRRNRAVPAGVEAWVADAPSEGTADGQLAPRVAEAGSDAAPGPSKDLPADQTPSVLSADVLRGEARPPATATAADGFDFSPEASVRIGTLIAEPDRPAPVTYEFGGGFTEFFAGAGPAGEVPDPFAWMDLNPEASTEVEEPALHGPPTPDP
jgi:hypothetical protein